MNRIAYFSEILKDLMIERDLTVSELSSLSGVNVSRIYDYLSGKAPATHNAIKIANVLKCSLDYLFGFEQENTLKDDYFLTSDCNQRLKSVIDQSGKSRYKISQDTGITQAQLLNWYKRYRIPKLPSLVSLAEYFNCSLDYLVGK